MAGGQRLGAQLARRVQQVGELHFLIAAHAGDRRFAPRIAVGEILDHALAEAAFVIQHIMGNAEALGHALGVIDVGAGAAGALARRRLVFGIKLQGDAHHVIALALEQRRGDGGIHAAGHGGDDTASGLEELSLMAGPIGPAPPEPQRKPADQPPADRQVIQQRKLVAARP